MLLPFFGLPVSLQKVKQQKPKLAQKPQVLDSDSSLGSSSSDSESESSTSPDKYVIPQRRKGFDPNAKQFEHRRSQRLAKKRDAV